MKRSVSRSRSSRARSIPTRRADGDRPTIAIVTDAIYPYHMGGKEIRSHNLCPRLAADGFDVHVFTMGWWDGPRSRTENGVRYTALSRARPLYVGERRSITQAVMFSLGCLRLLRHDFDAIDGDQMPYLPLFPLRFVAWVKRVPLLVTWHEVWGAAYWRDYLGRLGAVGAALEHIAMRIPDRIVTVDEETRRRLVSGGADVAAVHVLPNGVDRAEIAAAEPSARSFDLIYVGRLNEHKRVIDLIDAIGVIARDGEFLTCAIVGSGPERAHLERRASDLGLDEQVVFVGSLAHQSLVYGLIKSSGCLVLPSVREGFGIVVVEALACGVPVITTDHPANQARALVDDGRTGWLTKPSADALAAAIRRARTGSFDTARADRTLDRCDWDLIARRLGHLYDDLGSVA